MQFFTGNEPIDHRWLIKLCSNSYVLVILVEVLQLKIDRICNFKSYFRLYFHIIVKFRPDAFQEFCDVWTCSNDYYYTELQSQPAIILQKCYLLLSPDHNLNERYMYSCRGSCNHLYLPVKTSKPTRLIVSVYILNIYWFINVCKFYNRCFFFLSSLFIYLLLTPN